MATWEWEAHGYPILQVGPGTALLGQGDAEGTWGAFKSLKVL